MGLFSQFKELFNKNIECDEDLDSHILVFLKGKKYLYLGKNIIVRDNSVCVITYKNRVCDVLLPGKYKIAQDSLPECFSMAKVEKQNSKGGNVKKIRVKIFYINTTEFKDFNFDSKKPFSIKSKLIGKVKGCLCGKCTIRIIDPALYVKYLFNHINKFKENNVIECTSALIGNRINKVFEKCKIPFEMMFTDRNKVNSILNTEVEDSFDKQGIFVKNIQLKSVDVLKKYQQKVNEFASNQNQSKKPIINEEKNYAIGDSFKIPVRINNENLTSSSICKRCGHKNSPFDQMCTNCGNRLN